MNAFNYSTKSEQKFDLKSSILDNKLKIAGMFFYIAGMVSAGVLINRYNISKIPYLNLSDSWTKSVTCSQGQPKVIVTKNESQQPIFVEISCKL